MTITFGIATDAPLATLFVAPYHTPKAGAYVTLKTSATGFGGSLDRPAGRYAYTLILQGGAPHADYTLTITIGASDPIKREGELDQNGDGGNVGTFTVV